uniref:Small ribosomal subunit protein bS20c n=1 Tax=Hydropuntia rangiferina TaxID=338881 RepID=A0A345U8D9_9FLOR|nr:ribosomal protein S20 [Hydropuntia rangiferina]AXI96725.1 ribosomal protein S20 [Hydropuntia rangiferina]UAD87408.1 ribosomal protein S20 [Hydropuntia rangiferina]
MSQNVSAIKKAKISLRNKRRNKSYKSAIKNSIKKYLISLNNLTEIDKKYDCILKLSVAYKKIDQAISKGVLHKNNGSRKKSFLVKMMKKTTYKKS